MIPLSGCREGMYGPNCAQECNCEQGATCDIVTGKCFCPPGFVGPTCSNKCPFGYYGDGCSKSCDCQNNADCDQVTGQCLCKAGYMGERCEQGELVLLLFFNF